MKKVTAIILAVLFAVLFLSSCGDSSGGNLRIKYKIDGERAVVTGVPDNVTMPEIVIPDEYDGKPVTEIEDFSMVNLENVTKITIGKNVETIGPWAMENNKKLTAIEVSEENPFFCDIDGVLYSKDMKTLLFYPMARNSVEAADKDGNKIKSISYEIPEGVETVRTKAFYKCSDLRSIKLPSTVKVIEEKAFFRCSFTEIILPEALTFIGKDAFSYCSGLTEITIPDEVAEIGEYAFYNCTKLLTINVDSPEAELTLGNKWYPTDNGWDIKELVINYR